MELNETGSPLVALTINITEAELEELASIIENVAFVALNEGMSNYEEDAMLTEFVGLLRKALS